MSERVLIVEDDPDTVTMLLRCINGDTSATLVVSDSKLVQRGFAEFQPDLILLDLHMPDPDGFELLRRLQGARTSLGFLPVIVITGDTDRAARNRALALGANDFLTKPLDRHEVALRVRHLLHTRRLYVDLANTNEALEAALREKS